MCVFVSIVAIEWVCFWLGKRRRECVRERENGKRWKIGNGKLTKVVQRLFRTRTVWRHSDGDNSFHVEMPSHAHGTHEIQTHRSSDTWIELTLLYDVSHSFLPHIYDTVYLSTGADGLVCVSIGPLIARNETDDVHFSFSFLSVSDSRAFKIAFSLM